MMRVKKNDKVLVISGKDKGKTSSVIAISPKTGKIMVKDVAVTIRHVKARKQGDIPGIKREESYICLSKVMPICPSCKKPCRVGALELKDGKKARVCGQCKEVM
ncbi:MAG: 50S ribosomal protein L24 [Proteobacteria bacterium]|jgi:large subunit ribosomal protein L24|nr:50S ribosomal protein L24 [Pseudomonadota bacterium]NBP14692.1 50S ribosomal protein L24 [bacterium]